MLESNNRLTRGDVQAAKEHPMLRTRGGNLSAPRGSPVAMNTKKAVKKTATVSAMTKRFG